MTEDEEKAYERGYEMACEHIVTQCMARMSTWPERDKVTLLLERQAAIRMLRDLCAEHGDNDWPDDLYLEDIIEKHLGRYLR